MRLSIITINYNNIDGLIRTRDSIISQTFKDYEWIVIDGGSTDGAKDFLQYHNEEISYWCCEKDNGVYNAQNKGIAKAKGEYMIFMNSGDTFHDKDVLNTVFEEQQHADVLYGDWIQCFEDGHKIKQNAPKEVSLHFFYYDNICHQAMLIKSYILKKSPYNENYKIYADWAKWIKLVLAKCSFQYIPIVICNFMMNGISQINLPLCISERELLRANEFPLGFQQLCKNLQVLQEEIIKLQKEIKIIHGENAKFQEELRKYDIRNQDLQKELNITKQMYAVQTENLIQLQQKTNHRSIRMVWKIEDNIDKLNQKFSLGKYRRK